MEEYSIASGMLLMEAKRAAAFPWARAHLRKLAVSLRNASTSASFISVEPKLGAPNRAFTMKENDRLAFCSRLIVPRGALRFLTVRRFAGRVNFEKELHGQYTIHRRMIPLA